MTKSLIRNIFAVCFSLLLISVFGHDAQGQEGFEEWKENYLNEFKEFQNKYDKQFHEMLQKEWKKYDIKLSPDLYQKPKPKQLPKVEKTEPPRKPKATIKKEKPKKKEPSEKETQALESPKPTPGNEPEEVKQKIEAPSNKETGTAPAGFVSAAFEPNVKKAKVQTSSLTYFDIPIRYRYYAAYKTRIDRPVDKKSISEFWKHLSTKDYPAFLDQIKQVKAELSLNDYGYAQLLENIGSQIYGTGTYEATLFTWFMLTQSNFGTRIAYNKHGVYLLIKTSPRVFRTTYFTINGAKYYGLSFSKSYSQLPDELYTYEGDYPKSPEKELNLRFAELPSLPKKQESRTLNFSYRDSSYTFNIPVDLQIVSYFKNYPKADLDLYFNSRMEGETHDKLISSLQPLLEGKSDVEKANILLRFVQKSFDYKTDQEQFRTEKKMFPMEALYYPASDCDDRSILFAYLIEHMTDLQYIVLRYPGHLTPAVYFPNNSPKGSEIGQPITYDGKPYYITDPTYFGADAGMVMTKYENVQPEEIYDL